MLFEEFLNYKHSKFASDNTLFDILLYVGEKMIRGTFNVEGTKVVVSDILKTSHNRNYTLTIELPFEVVVAKVDTVNEKASFGKGKDKVVDIDNTELKDRKLNDSIKDILNKLIQQRGA